MKTSKTYRLGLSIPDAIVEYEYNGQCMNPPPNAADWRIELDWVYVTVRVSLPCEESHNFKFLHKDIPPFDEGPTQTWGVVQNRRRYKENQFGAPTKEEAMADATQWAEKIIYDVRIAVRKRVERLAVREARLRCAEYSADIEQFANQSDDDGT